MKPMFLAVLTVVLLSASVALADGPSLTVEYWAGNQPRVLRPLKSVPAGSQVVALDALPLVRTEPALLRLGEATYSLQGEGLYRIREQGSSRVVRQTILYRGDVWRFAGHLTRLYVYGRRHQADNPAQLEERARGGEPFSVQCGAIALFVVQQMSARKIPARVVQCVTGTDWNHFDDGHVLLEVFDPGEMRWILFDATLGARFRHRGRWLDLVEMTRLYRSGGRAEQVDFVNASSKLDPLENYEGIYGPFLQDEKALAAYLDGFRRLLNGDVQAVHHWYKRVMQIPLIKNSFVPGSDAEDALLRTLPGWKALERLSPAQFRERFYAPSVATP